MADVNLSGAVAQESAPQPEIVSDTLSNLLGSDDLFRTPIIADLTLSDFIGAGVVVGLTILIISILTHLTRKVLTGKVDGTNIDGLNRFIVWVFIFIGFLGVCPYLHIDLSGLLVAGGVVAVAVGFACQTTMSNLVAGILLMFERPISIGQDIQAGSDSGYVESIGILSTTLRTYEGVYVRVPNNTLFNSNITNYTADISRRFDLSIDISYSEDTIPAKEIILKTLDEYPMVLKNPAPIVFVSELAADGVILTARQWAPATVWKSSQQVLREKIYHAIAEAGIDIPFSQLTIWFGAEEAQKIRDAKERLREQKLLETAAKEKTAAAEEK